MGIAWAEASTKPAASIRDLSVKRQPQVGEAIQPAGHHPFAERRILAGPRYGAPVGVADRESSAGSQDAVNLAQCRTHVSHELERLHAHAGVEIPVFERE